MYADFKTSQKKYKFVVLVYQNHNNCSYAYKVICWLNQYRGVNAVFKFMEQMLSEVNYFKEIIKNEFDKPLKMTNKDEENFKKADECLICDKIILTKIFV